jgi:hypothetical protein
MEKHPSLFVLLPMMKKESLIKPAIHVISKISSLLTLQQNKQERFSLAVFFWLV